MNKIQRLATRLVATALTLSALGFAHNVWAHAKLESSQPAANSTLNLAPTEVALNFEHPTTLIKFALVEASQGKPLPIVFKASATPAETHKIPLPPLGNGQYSVNWSAMAKDGHNMSGGFVFTIKNPEAPASSAPNKASAPVIAPAVSNKPAPKQ